MSADKIEPCRWCGADHGPLCPWVRAYELDASGNIIRVEFLTPKDCVTVKESDAEAEDGAGDYPKLRPMKGI